jgi:hypothetical protein
LPFSFYCTFSVYTHGSWTLGKAYVIKPRCYGEHLEECIWQNFGNLGTWWQHVWNEVNWIIHKCMLSLPVVCMKFLVSKVFITGFLPRLMAGAELGVRGT